MGFTAVTPYDPDSLVVCHGFFLRKETMAMKRRALGAVIAAVLTSALTGSLAWGDNPHGTPPGQAANDQTSASVTASASASAENKGQAKKAEESSQSSSSAGPSANASATAQANAAEHAQSNSSSNSNNSNTVQSNSSTSSNTSASNTATTKLTPGGDTFNGCTGTPNTSGSPGVKPGSNTDKWTCAKAVASTAGAAADQTKRYGNGSTAGQGVVKRGGLGTTLYGPGNSQPHMVKPCPNSRHMRDWHSVKNFNPALCASTSTQTTTPTTSSTT